MPVKRKPLNGAQRARKYEALQRWRKKNPWYVCLRAAKQRCNNKNHDSYPNYGGRGIRCLLTLKEIKQLWVRNKAYNLKKPSLDRKHEDKNYTLDNGHFMDDNVTSGQHG